MTAWSLSPTVTDSSKVPMRSCRSLGELLRHEDVVDVIRGSVLASITPPVSRGTLGSEVLACLRVVERHEAFVRIALGCCRESRLRRGVPDNRAVEISGDDRWLRTCAGPVHVEQRTRLTDLLVAWQADIRTAIAGPHGVQIDLGRAADSDGEDVFAADARRRSASRTFHSPNPKTARPLYARVPIHADESKARSEIRSGRSHSMTIAMSGSSCSMVDHFFRTAPPQFHTTNLTMTTSC